MQVITVNMLIIGNSHILNSKVDNLSNNNNTRNIFMDPQPLPQAIHGSENFVKFNFTSFFTVKKNKQKAVLLLILLLLLSCCVNKQLYCLLKENKNTTTTKGFLSHDVYCCFFRKKKKKKIFKKLPHPTIFSMRIYRLLFKF